MSMNGTRSYADLPPGVVVPPLVQQAVDRASELGFELCVRPEIGRLLAVLAGGLSSGSTVGETGTGTGAGLAWMVSSARADVQFLSYELDPDRAAASQALFADHDNVTVVHGDSGDLYGRGPFDLLVLDGGPGSGKNPGDRPIDPAVVLAPGGAMTIDDYGPTVTWPPRFQGEVDAGRAAWLERDDVTATEIRVAPDLAVIVIRRFPSEAGSVDPRT